ncbi:MAG: carboxypeptidase-like regulatory domain-containing protein [Candidatus Cyclobacteriaceae bacterium M3_2C_046]
MKYIYLFLWVSFLGGFSLESAAQEVKIPDVSGNFDQVPFDQFVKIAENQTAFYFYYDKSQTDSLQVSASLNQVPLDQALRQILQGSDFHFALKDHNVFITYEQEIRTELPIGFFDSKSDSVQFDISLFDYLDEQVTVSQKNALENKLFEIGPKSNNIKQGNSNLAGSVTDAESGEPVIGALVYIEEPWIGTATDAYGYFSITLPRGRHELKVKSIGMKDTRRQIMLYGDGKMNIELQQDVIPLREVVIESEKDANVSGMQVGLEKIDIKSIKQVPTALGELDVMKVTLTLPGVQSVGESTTGLNVRGGATDQNLILFNDAIIYNPAHLFGFFSAFNPDVLKNVTLYKSGIPAEYGGRLSSVLEVTTRDGNKKKFTGSGGIGLITGRLTLEGPLIKDKSSFLIGGRSTYSDWLLKSLPNDNLNDSEAAFNDVNLHLTHEFNEKNNLYLTGYMSNDRFKLNSDTLYRYNNRNAVLKWKHIFKNELYGVFTGGFNQYKYQMSSDRNPVNAYQLDYKINQSNLKADFSYFPNAKHTIKFGLNAFHYDLTPGNFSPLGDSSLINQEIIQKEQAIESALYLNDQFDISPLLSLSVGLRYSFFHNIGPKEVFIYGDERDRRVSNMVDTVRYQSGDLLANYQGPEFRFSARYILNPTSSVKLSYNRMRQYIHMLSNTTAIAPTDIWKLSDNYIRPQVGDQYSLGYYKNFKANTIETSAEVYYKKMNDFLDFKSGARLILNPHIETDIINAEGMAYGLEMMVKKLTGKLNGWVSYTYSRSMVRIDASRTSDVVNDGAFFPSNFDKPHDFTMVGNYRFSRRFSISLNFTYSTGRPITLPQAKYDYEGSKRILYSDRNQFRIPDFYRADFSMNIEGNHKVRKLNHSSWTIAVYNLTGRKNAYSIFFDSENGNVKGYQLSIFGRPIPTVTYNFKF